MNTYTYTDRSKYPKITKVFSCEAESILQADAQYEAATGNKPEKQAHVHCQIEFGKTAGA